MSGTFLCQFQSKLRMRVCRTSADSVWNGEQTTPGKHCYFACVVRFFKLEITSSAVSPPPTSKTGESLSRSFDISFDQGSLMKHGESCSGRNAAGDSGGKCPSARMIWSASITSRVSVRSWRLSQTGKCAWHCR